MAALRVCLVTDCFPPAVGGIESHVYCLAGELAALGHDVDVVTHGIPAGFSSLTFPDPAGVNVIRLERLLLDFGGADPVIDPRVFGDMRGLLQRGRYSIVHCHSTASLLVLAALLAAPGQDVPACLTKHSMTVRASRPGFVNRALLTIEGLLMRKLTHALFALNAEAADEMATARVPVTVISGGVDSSHWRVEPEWRRTTRQSLGYSDDHVVIGFLSRVVSTKGIDTFIRVAASLASGNRSLRFLVVGDGPDRESARRLAARLGLEGVCAFIGAKPWRQTPFFYNAMDVYAFPSFTEACGLAPLEAMACGVPTVAWDNAGTRTTVAPAVTGYLVSDEAEMAERIDALARDAGQRLRMGRRAREQAIREHSWQSVAVRTASAYEAAIAAWASRQVPIPHRTPPAVRQG